MNAISASATGPWGSAGRGRSRHSNAIDAGPVHALPKTGGRSCCRGLWLSTPETPGRRCICSGSSRATHGRGGTLRQHPPHTLRARSGYIRMGGSWKGSRSLSASRPRPDSATSGSYTGIKPHSTPGCLVCTTGLSDYRQDSGPTKTQRRRPLITSDAVAGVSLLSAVAYDLTSSTRRLFARPSAVLLSADGLVSP